MATSTAGLAGATASPGISEGTAAVHTSTELPRIEGPGQGPETEVQRLGAAVDAALAELAALKERTRSVLGTEYAHIFRSQQTVLEDNTVFGDISTIILSEPVCAEAAVRTVFDRYIELFRQLEDDSYNKGRMADIQDVGTRVLRNLMGIKEGDLSALEPGSIVVARELFPSDTMLLNPDVVVGIVTETGGVTSHVAILAKNLGIPCAVGVHGAVDRCSHGDIVVLDASDSLVSRVYINPNGEIRSRLVERKEARTRYLERVETARGKPSQTPDGLRVAVAANVGSSAELGPAAAAGAHEVGLYRSEFLFLGDGPLPDEDRQYRAYRDAADAFRDGSVIIRTLDIGGDKTLPGLSMPHEDNPFLGNRALRLCLSMPDLFHTQLRAILRASSGGNVKLMFPMVGGLPELEQAIAAVGRAKAELKAENQPFNDEVEIGVMIEVPSAVWIADALAQRVSFFSIGTNDLTQYLMAADRLNGAVDSYYRSYDPSVFRAIRHVVAATRDTDVWVGVCGELGGDPVAVPALIGLGVRELSMSPGSLAEVNWIIRNTTLADMEKLAQQVLALDEHTEIRALLRDHFATKE